MKVFIAQDDQTQVENLRVALRELGHTCIGSADNSFAAMEEIRNAPPDVILIDVHLKGYQSGITLGKMISNVYKIPIVFTVKDFTSVIISEGVNASPVGYLAMPFDKSNLQANLLLAKKRYAGLNHSDSNSISNIFIKNGAKLVKVVLDTILFIYTDTKNYCSLITTDNKKLSVRYSIQGIYKLLDEGAFVQSHRSYIINWRKVDTIYESDQTLEIQGHHIPIGRTYKKNIYTKLNII